MDSNEYLADGFRFVDAAQHKEAYFDCLNLLDSLPYYQEAKKRSYELLDLHGGVTVLEAGCGLGHDVFRMAKLVQPDGQVTGLDSSEAMITTARANPLNAALPVSFVQGDIQALPFPDQSFSRCRIDRTLQHIEKPEKAVSELVRVLKPDGLLLAYDNDWNTFSINSGCTETNRKLESLWINSFANPSIGGQLQKYFESAGITDSDTYRATSVIRDFSTADKVYNLRLTMEKAVQKGFITRDAGNRWMDELYHLQVQDALSVKLTAYTVLGRKPF